MRSRRARTSTGARTPTWTVAGFRGYLGAPPPSPSDFSLPSGTSRRLWRCSLWSCAAGPASGCCSPPSPSPRRLELSAPSVRLAVPVFAVALAWSRKRRRSHGAWPAKARSSITVLLAATAYATLLRSAYVGIREGYSLGGIEHHAGVPVTPGMRAPPARSAGSSPEWTVARTDVRAHAIAGFSIWSPACTTRREDFPFASAFRSGDRQELEQGIASGEIARVCLGSFKSSGRLRPAAIESYVRSRLVKGERVGPPADLTSGSRMPDLPPPRRRLGSGRVRRACRRSALDREGSTARSSSSASLVVSGPRAGRSGGPVATTGRRRVAGPRGGLRDRTQPELVVGPRDGAGHRGESRARSNGRAGGSTPSSSAAPRRCLPGRRVRPAGVSGRPRARRRRRAALAGDAQGDRSGGVLLLTVPAYPRLFSAHDEAAGHRSRYSPRRLVELARRTGWKPICATHFNLVLLPVARGWRRALASSRLHPPHLRARTCSARRGARRLLRWPLRAEAAAIRAGPQPAGRPLDLLGLRA